MKEENKIVIDLGYDNLQLIVERNLDPGYNEVFVGLERNGVWVQDLAIVGQQYHYGDDCNVIGENGMRVLVYADAENEDYTHEFKIDVYHDPEETVTKEAVCVDQNIDIDKTND